jgi:ATP-dependent DNA helicase PIF1
MMPVAARSFYSIDKIMDEEEATSYPVEFLNSLNTSGLPQHKLTLKVGSPIMLLRNLDPPKLCNGTRLVVKTLNTYVIEATILTGAFKGENVFLPRIPLIPSDLPFRFKRLQFPIRLAFAMTINKSQGQSLNVTGIDLRDECFSHGQFYVAMSRAENPKNLYVLAENNSTKNIVYAQVLKD